MTIKTKFNIHQRVFNCDFLSGKIRDFIIEEIEIEVSLLHSGGGGTVGVNIAEKYFSNEGEYGAGHNLYKSRKNAKRRKRT